MVKGIGNINKHRSTGGMIRNSRRLKRKQNKHSTNKRKLNRQKAIKEALNESNTTKQLIKQNKSNPNANLLISNKKRRLVLRNRRIRDKDNSKMEVTRLNTKKLMSAVTTKSSKDKMDVSS
ncbi:hypothetical protein LOD99_939 [Oopsacas minuta]|uniref:Uncharacterized protein n=1 Tax=Oopsacas minuta TaxID=111878 RepID=A0AAV7JZZ4_9METZ|nr:hypothetical protein LOD99_939 [Oopsacas minuta]